MTKYMLTCWSDEYVIDADLSQASAQILVDGDSTPYQTADCRHYRDELASLIAAYLYRDTSDCDDAADNAEIEEITADWIAEQDSRPKVIETVGTYIACCYGSNGDEPGECEMVIECVEANGVKAYRWADRDDSGTNDTGDWSLDYEEVEAAAKKEIEDRDETPDDDEQVQEILDAGWFAADVDADDIRGLVDYCHKHNNLGQGHVIIDRDGHRKWVTTGYVEHEAMYISIPHGGQPWSAYAVDILHGTETEEDEE